MVIIMTRAGVTRLFIALLSAVILCTPSLAVSSESHVQFCWALGKFDHTIYFAEVGDREDRQASFDGLLEISGIEHDTVQCRVSDATSHRRVRAHLLREWRDSELEMVNTTFLSDLDY
jgi:hypothetical protein